MPRIRAQTGLGRKTVEKELRELGEQNLKALVIVKDHCPGESRRYQFDVAVLEALRKRRHPRKPAPHTHLKCAPGSDITTQKQRLSDITTQKQPGETTPTARTTPDAPSEPRAPDDLEDRADRRTSQLADGECCEACGRTLVEELDEWQPAWGAPIFRRRCVDSRREYQRRHDRSSDRADPLYDVAVSTAPDRVPRGVTRAEWRHAKEVVHAVKSSDPSENELSESRRMVAEINSKQEGPPALARAGR